MYWGHRKLMLPWLFLQGFLASILASLACYYLALFPLKISCIGRRDANFRQTRHSYSPLATASVISSASIINTRVEEEEETSAANSTNAGSSCQPLLWYSVIMILSLLILVYYFYIVQVRKGLNTKYIHSKLPVSILGFSGSTKRREKETKHTMENRHRITRTTRTTVSRR